MLTQPILAHAIFIAGFAQLSVLIASALVPVRLQWRTVLADLPPLYRQLVWCYGGYIVLSITALGLICITKSAELATGNSLARAVCLYGAVFWGVRLSLQPVFAAQPFLTTWWLRAGYHALTLWFAGFVAVYLCGAIC